MIYTLENTIYQGRPITKIIDANGFVYEANERIIECDTETGDMTRYQRDEVGCPVIDEQGELMRVTEKATPPLIVVFKIPKDA